MSEVEQLAVRLEEEADYDIHHLTKYALRQAAAELRRLTAVEKELEALKRAISDAETVAWMIQWTNHSPSFTTDKSDYVSWFAGKASYPDGLIPLYTLKGIK